MYDIAEKHGTIEKDFEKMNVLNVVYVPKGLAKEKLLHYQRRFMKEFYLRLRIIVNYFKRLTANPSNIFEMFKK